MPIAPSSLPARTTTSPLRRIPPQTRTGTIPPRQPRYRGEDFATGSRFAIGTPPGRGRRNNIPPRVQLVERGTARPRIPGLLSAAIVGGRYGISPGHRAGRGVEPDAVERDRECDRGPGSAQNARAGERGTPPRLDVLYAEREHIQGSAVGEGTGNARRGSVSHESLRRGHGRIPAVRR